MSRPFIPDEYLSVIKSLKTRSAPGPDLITNFVITQLPLEMHKYIIFFFNYMFTKITYPAMWREYFVVFIPKPGRKNAYRPISLAINIFKIMEKLICRRLEWWVENNKLLSPHQFGFRRGLSCIDNLTMLVSHIKIANNSREITGAVFLDVEGAFDNVDPNTLLTMLPYFRIPTPVIAFLEAAITSRKLDAYVSGQYIQSRSSCRGLGPQGSVLSPILFNLYMSRVESHLPPSTHALIYADDIVLYSSDQSISNVAQNLNHALDTIHDHLKTLRLNLSPEKSVATFFSLNSRRNIKWLIKKHDVKLALNEQNVRVEWSVRFLGVHLDYVLNWKRQMAETRKRVLPRINILKALSGIRWEAHPSTLITAYRRLVRSVLEWGCQVMYPLGKRESLVLDRLLFACASVACGLMRTTPTNVLLDVVGEQPLVYRHRYLLSKHLSKVVARKDHPFERLVSPHGNEWNPIRDSNYFGLLDVRRKEISHLTSQVNTYSLPGDLLIFPIWRSFPHL